MADIISRRFCLTPGVESVAARVFVQDCRDEESRLVAVGRERARGYEQLRGVVRKELEIGQEEVFVLCTTSREAIDNDESWEAVQDGDTLYVLEHIDAELVCQAQQLVNFLPHYDTIVKGGMYEYYASEGHNPLPYAFAELIDNALTATAENSGERNIEIRMFVDQERHNKNSIMVLDNGKGMTSRQLNNWAIYRLSKFIRRDATGRLNVSEEEAQETVTPVSTPRFLNSDISYFGVGGKQAIFFVGTNARMITRSKGFKDVHELTISKEEFEQKEKNKEAIYSSFIRNRKPGDVSHLKDDEEMLSDLVRDELTRDCFTAVVITGINPSHTQYLRSRVNDWTRQLAHIYHYYIHGPNGNVDSSSSNDGIARADERFSNINIVVKLYTKSLRDPAKVINLRDIVDDPQTRMFRSAESLFEFRATVEGSRVVEGMLRYHPFKYDRETFPQELSLPAGPESQDVEDDDSVGEDLRQARGKRPIFECFWNGRLIPYSTIEDLEWCTCPKKSKQVPLECYNRVSGVLWTNDKFQVSTNKLTFIDLEVKLRDKNTTYARLITKESKKGGKKSAQDIVVEKRTEIGREFTSWLKDCHEACDKQIKFCQFVEVVSRPELPRARQTPWSVYRQVEWDDRVLKKGTLVRVLRVIPVVLGSVLRVLLYGEHGGGGGDVYATGGEVEVQMEPRALFDEVRIYPLKKIDMSATADQIKKCIDDEEARLPDKLVVSFPSGDEVKNGSQALAGLTIGDMKVEISNRRGELISKLPGSQQKKLLIEQKITYHAPTGDQQLAQHISQHGKTWPYWFRKMENIKELGRYTLELQAATNESGACMVAGKRLPSHVIKFTVIEAEPEKFTIGFLESPFRIGIPFQMPLEFQDGFGHATKPLSKLKPELSASALDISYADKQIKGSTMILKDIIALGSVPCGPGKSFVLTIKIPGLKEPTNTLKIRLLTGTPVTMDVMPDAEVSVENGQNVDFDVTFRDLSGNEAINPKLSVKFIGVAGADPMVVPCPSSSVHIRAPISIKQIKGTETVVAKFEAVGVKGIPCVERVLRVQPSRRAALLEVCYGSGPGAKPTPIKTGQEICGVCGEAIKDITFAIKDEAGREREIDEALASHVKVNWTPKLTTNMVLQGRLPPIKLSSLVADAKYCQVTLTDGSGLQFGFNVKGVAGEPTNIKCAVSGSNQTRLGEKLKSDVHVLVRDSYGNEIKKFEKGVLFDLVISGEGLLRTEMITSLGQTSGFTVQGINFVPGPIGTRELCFEWRGMKDYVRLEIVAGPPMKLQLPGWIAGETTVLNERRLPRELLVQLSDEAGNPSPEENIKVQLVPDPALKLSPSILVLKTSKKGEANFGVFSVSAKIGVYEIQVKAFVGRSSVLSCPNLVVVVQPDPSKPVAVNVLYDLNTRFIAGDAFPDFVVSVLGEHEEVMSMTKASCLSMKLWRADDKSGQTGAFSHMPDKQTLSDRGIFYFRRREVPILAAKHLCVFVYDDGKHQVSSQVMEMVVEPRPPVRLAPAQNPGTPAVSNARSVASRTLIRSVSLELRDEYDNVAGASVDGKLIVEIVSSASDITEVPTFVGNTRKMFLKMINGKVLLQNLQLQESTPGKDGHEYSLMCTLTAAGLSSIPPYSIPFLFYNDLKKQAQMSMLSKERDNLLLVIDTYKSLFDTTQELTNELKASLADCQQEENKLKAELRKYAIPESQLTVTVLDATLQNKQAERLQLLKQPRRVCGLPPAPLDSQVVGKIGHLAEVRDAEIARVLSWHMSADMDCIVTLTTKKAQAIHHQSQGRQQVLPLDSIYQKALPDWNKPLPHQRMRPNWRPLGNPEYARATLVFPRDVEHCRTVFGMLLGDTMLFDTLEDGTAYRQEVVRFTHCPTILTRAGERIRSNGKFGGLLNMAWSLEKLRGAVFGQPVDEYFQTLSTEIDLLQSYKESILKRLEAETDLSDQLQSQSTPEVKVKLRELQEAEEQMRGIEARLGLSVASESIARLSLGTVVPCSAVPSVQDGVTSALSESCLSPGGKNRRLLRRSAPEPAAIVSSASTPKRRKRN